MNAFLKIQDSHILINGLLMIHGDADEKTITVNHVDISDLEEFSYDTVEGYRVALKLIEDQLNR